MPSSSEAAPSLHRYLAVYCTTHFIVGMSSALLGPTLPALAEQTTVAPGLIGFLFTIRALARLIGAVVSSYLFDHFPGHPIFISSILIIMVTMIITGNARTVLLVSVVFFFMGMAEALLDVGANTLLLRVKQGEPGASIPTLHFAYSFGSFVAPLLVAQIIQLYSDAMVIYYVLPVLLLLSLPFLARTRSPLHDRPRITVAETAVQVSRPWLLIGLLLLFIGLYVGIEASFSGWIYTYATRSHIATDIQAAYLTSIYWGLLSPGRLLVIPLSRWYPPRLILSVALTGIVISAFVVTQATDMTTIFAGTACFGLFMAPVFPTIFNLAGATLHMTGQITGWFFVSAGLAAMICPWLIGLLFGAYGTVAIVTSILILILIMVVSYVALHIRLEMLPVSQSD